MNTGTIKEVAYVECHQAVRSYTNHYEYMSYYANRGVEVEHSSPSSDYWSLMYTVKQTRDHPPIMIMGIKVLDCKLTSVNKCFEVEHLRESIDQWTLMYSQKIVDVKRTCH